MEFTIKQSVLKEGLGAVAGCVDKTKTIPVLNNVLIESLGENSIRITATDMDVTIRRDAEAEIVTGGAMCVEARKLIDITRNLPDGEMRFVKDKNDWVRTACGKSKFKFAGRRREEFPETVAFKSAPIRISCDTLQTLIQRVMPAVTTIPSRFTLDGAKLEIGNGNARMVSTDGHRMAIADAEVDSDKELSLLIPKKALTEILKLNADMVSIGEDRNHIFLDMAGTLFVARKLTGTFPNYQMVIPKDADRLAAFDIKEMLGALKRAGLIAGDRKDSVHVELGSGEIAVTATSSDGEEADERLETDYDGEAVKLIFQCSYLVEFLNVVADSKGKASIAFSDSYHATVLSIDETYRYILMPQRTDVVERRETTAVAEKAAA
jgi:DNA polymerase-3 subunit beta